MKKITVILCSLIIAIIPFFSFNSVKAEMTGKNLFDVNTVNYGFANTINKGLSNGVYSATGVQNGSVTYPSWSSGAIYIGQTYFNGSIANDLYNSGTYTLSFNYKVVSQGASPLSARFLVYSKDIDTLVTTNLIDISVSTVQIGDNLQEFTFTINEEMYIYSTIYINLCEVKISNYQIEYGTTATVYEPYYPSVQTRDNIIDNVNNIVFSLLNVDFTYTELFLLLIIVMLFFIIKGGL